MKRLIAGFFLLTGFFGKSEGAYCSGSPNPNAAPNNQPIYDVTPTLLSQTENGLLYTAGPSDQQFYITHVYGDPYQMGYAQGTLLKEQLVTFIDDVWTYLVDQIPLHTVAPDLANYTLEEALDLTAELTGPYTPVYWYDELRGLSDATGLSYQTLLRVHMLPELTKGSCSMFGCWGDATPDGKLLQLRALDWDTDGPFKDYPAITVYHPAPENGNVFANIGFNGFIGAVTGISEKRLSISEIGVSYPDDTFGKESRRGYPFVFILRDFLQYDNNVNNVTYRIENAHRTCDLILGAGCGRDDPVCEEVPFRAYEYSYSTANVYDDTNMEPYNQTWHPRIENIVYYGMDWLCPNYDEVLSEQLLDFYGNITVENSITNIVAKTQTGSLHVALYDYANDDLYFSVHARSNDNSQYQDAYARSYVRIALSDLFLEDSSSLRQNH